MGLTGASVVPKLYLALGIDGDTSQFMATQEAGMIVAVQPYLAVPFVRVADYATSSPIRRSSRARRRRFWASSAGVRHSTSHAETQRAQWQSRNGRNCALALRLGVRLSGIGGASGVDGGLTPRNTECTLELSVEVADRLLLDDREQSIGPLNGPLEGASK